MSSDTPERRARIIEIINSGKIRTQDELLSILKSNGIDVTQATLSRDLRAIGAVKVHDVDAGFHYRISESNNNSGRKLYIKVEHSGQFCIVKTQPGYASAIASVIDKSSISGIMGTLAGDDTVLVVIRQETDGAHVADLIRSL